MLSKVPIFSGLHQGLEVAEGQRMFFKQYYISCKKKIVNINWEGTLKKTKELLGVFKVKFIPTANGKIL